MWHMILDGSDRIVGIIQARRRPDSLRFMALGVTSASHLPMDRADAPGALPYGARGLSTRLWDEALVHQEQINTPGRDGDVSRWPCHLSVNGMDAVAVDAVVEARAECADLERARAALGDALREARGPRRDGARVARWNVTVRVSQPSSAERRAEGVIVDDRGTLVAQRTISDRGGRTCVPFARAVGAWASLVLDDEMARARDGAATADTSASTATTTTTSEPIARSEHPAAPSEAEPDHAPANAASQHTVEVGGMMMLRGGDGTGGFAAFSPYANFEIARGWLFRPSVAVGRSPAREGLIVGMTRVDLCRRVPGNYIERRGIELDVCAGADVVRISDAFASTTGLALNLRGELGAGLAIELRSAAGVVLTKGPIVQPDDGPPIMATAELGLSVRLP